MGKAEQSRHGGSCEHFPEARNAAFRPQPQFIHSLIGNARGITDTQC